MISLDEFKNSITKKIENNYREAIKELSTVLKDGSNSKNLLTVIKASVSKLKNDEIMGILPYIESTKSHNEVIYRLVQLVQEIDTEELLIFEKGEDKEVKNVIARITNEKEGKEFLRKIASQELENDYGIIGILLSKKEDNRNLIFAKAFNKSKNKNIKEIPIKILLPLIEEASLEDNETLQDAWANLIAHSSTNESLESFDKKCINTLSNISIIEINVLDELYKYALNSINSPSSSGKKMEYILERHFDSGSRHLTRIKYIKSLKDSRESDKGYVVDNLLSLGLIQRGPIEINPDFYDNEVSIDVDNSEEIGLSFFGIKFINVCKFGLE